MSPIGSTFAFDEKEKEEGHDNSRNGSKGGNATKEFLKRRHGWRLPSNSDETELKPPAKSQSTPRRSKDQDKTHPSLGKVTAMIKKRPNIHIISNSHFDYAMNLLLLILVPMQDSKTVM